MSVGLVAIHHPRAETRDELISRVQKAAEIMSQTPGCQSAECWATATDDTIVTTGQWESDDAMAAGFAAVQAAGVDFDYDERESRPRNVIRLIEPRG
ncbi:MAG: putative quinol monooxygenase [Pseudonocardiaceae bacterium]